MDRSSFVRKFAKRLNFSLQKEGYTSTRAKSGTEIAELAKVAGVSYQMARKYSLGMALPEFHLIHKIAKWLNISPSWLLFGENEFVVPEVKSSSIIEIETELLKYILNKCTVLFPKTTDSEKIIQFIVGVIYDASHINADSKTILKIIDMMLSSALQINDIKLEKRA